MESKKNDDDISINADAPPVPNMFNQVNNNINNNNDINPTYKNLNIYPNIQNNNQININKGYNPINLGGNKIMQPSYFNINNPYYPNNYQKSMMNLNNMNYFNYFQHMKNNSYNNNFYMHNNKKNPINFNQNANNININKNNYSNLYDLDLQIETEFLKKLGRNYLIDIVLFMRDICKIKIPSELASLKHDIFNVKKIGRKGNNYKFYIKANYKKRLKLIEENKFIEKIDDLFENNEIKFDNDNSDDDNSNNIINDNNCNEENIINENNINKEKKENNISNIFFCDVHNKIFISKDDYETHLKTHKKCSICGMEFKYKNELKAHRKKNHANTNANNNNNIRQENKNMNNNTDNKIKCTECDLFFDSIELMSSHFYKIHEKNKKEEIKIKDQPKQDEKIEIKNEQNKKQDDIKINEEKDNINNIIENKKNEKDNLKRFQYKRILKYAEDECDNLNEYNKDNFPYFCSICKKGFPSYKSYNKHVKKHL